MDKGLKIRMLFVLGLFGLCAVGVIARAAQIQIIQAARLRELARRQHLHTVEVEAKRGDISDAREEPLALSREQAQVYARPEQLKEPRTAAAALAPILNLGEAELAKKMASRSAFVWLHRSASLEQAQAIDALGLEGIGALPASQRLYPGNTIAANLLGFVRIDGEGIEGLEYFYNNLLSGETIKVWLERDARGKAIFLTNLDDGWAPQADSPLSAAILQKAPRGANLKLTIVKQLQYQAEKELEKGVIDAEAKGGCAMAMEPDTGKIVFMASYPTFDPNEFSHYSQDDFRNRCVSMVYEPGSTFKIFTVAAALEDAVIKPDEKFFCENGLYVMPGATIKDVKPHGWLTIDKILEKSSNIGAAKIAERLGKEKMHRACRAFGFGARTGIDFPGESQGLLRGYESWTQVDLATVGFGQGVAVTPIQLLTGMCALANGGVMPRPYLAETATRADGAMTRLAPPATGTRVVTAETARTMTAFMKQVVSASGTGKNARLLGYEVAGKTGTAQKAKEQGPGYAEGKYIASFMGFLPADRPRLAIIVILDEPSAGRIYGGEIAAPVFAAIASQAMIQLMVPADAPGEGPDGRGPGAGLKIEEESGTAAERIRQWRERREVNFEAAPLEGSSAMVAPDLINLTLRQALRVLEGRPVKVEVHGSGVVVAMDPAPGEPIEEMGVLRLQLEDRR